MILQRSLRVFFKGRRGERGATAVEFSIVSAVFLMFVLGIIDMGRLFWVKNLMQYGVEESTRYAMVNPSITASGLEAYAASQVGSMFSGITFTADAPGADVVGGVNFRTVSAAYTFTYIMPFSPMQTQALSASNRTPVNEPL